LRTFALGPAPALSPWFSVAPNRATGLFLAAAPAATEQLALQWGDADGKRVTIVGRGRVAADAGSDARPDVPYWRFYAAGDLPARPPQANAVRYALRTTAAPGGSVGVTTPASYDTEPLAALLSRAPSVALPNLLAYVPCVRQPRVAETVEVPSAIVGFRDSIWPLSTDHSPFIDLPELYPFVRLPLSDSVDPPGGVAVYEVVRSLPGAAVARPDTMSGT
jgi:hypothetical protein